MRFACAGGLESNSAASVQINIIKVQCLILVTADSIMLEQILDIGFRAMGRRCKPTGGSNGFHAVTVAIPAQNFGRILSPGGKHKALGRQAVYLEVMNAGTVGVSMNQTQAVVCSHDSHYRVLIDIHDFLGLFAFMKVAAKTVPARHQ